MSFHDLLYLSDLLGTFVFAISGALVGVRKKMDMFGVVVLGAVTASGGGTLRSVLIDAPVPFLKDINYLLVSVLGGLLVFCFRDYVNKRGQKVLLYDAFGLAVFLSIGTTVGLDHGLNYWASVLMGMITAAFGGVIRDMMAAEVPLIFQKELYATLTLLGGLIYIGLYQLSIPQAYVIFIASGFVFAARVLSLKYNLSLPK